MSLGRTRSHHSEDSPKWMSRLPASDMASRSSQTRGRRYTRLPSGSEEATTRAPGCGNVNVRCWRLRMRGDKACGQLWRSVPNDEVRQVLQRVVEVVLPERRELEVLAHLGWDR